MGRAIGISALWIAYLTFPVFATPPGIFARNQLPFAPRWDELLMHILAFWGYCTIGCWLYALTNQQTDFPNRIADAMLFSLAIVGLFSLMMLAHDW